MITRLSNQGMFQRRSSQGIARRVRMYLLYLPKEGGNELCVQNKRIAQLQLQLCDPLPMLQLQLFCVSYYTPTRSSSTETSCKCNSFSVSSSQGVSFFLFLDFPHSFSLGKLAKNSDVTNSILIISLEYGFNRSTDASSRPISVCLSVSVCAPQANDVTFQNRFEHVYFHSSFSFFFFFFSFQTKIFAQVQY